MDVCMYRSLCYLMAAINLCENSTVHTAPIWAVPSRPDSIADRACAGKSVSKKESSTVVKLRELIERSKAGHRVRATKKRFMSEKLSLIAHFFHRKILRMKMKRNSALDPTVKI